MKLKFDLRKLRRGWVWLLLVLSVLFIVWIIIDINLRPLIVDMAEAKVRALTVMAINDAVQTTVREEPYFTDLVEAVKDDEGRITLLKANTLRMNELSTRATLTTQQRLNDIGDQGVKSPLGSVLGSQILQGSGPYIKVKTVPVGSVTAEFVTEFESVGINQTRHKMYLKVKANVRIVIPRGAQTVEVVVPVLISESIIVGQVPEYYLNNENSEDLMNLVPGQ